MSKNRRPNLGACGTTSMKCPRSSQKYKSSSTIALMRNAKPFRSLTLRPLKAGNTTYELFALRLGRAWLKDKARKLDKSAASGTASHNKRP